MTRRGMTLVETIMAFVVGSILLFVVYQVYAMGTRSGRAAESSTAVTALGILENTLYQDLVQIAADPGNGSSIKVRPEEIAFYIPYWEDNTQVDLYPIHYSLQRSPGGNQLLMRTDFGQPPEAVPNVFLRDVKFTLAARNTLHVEGRVLEADLADSAGLNSVRSVPLHLVFGCGIPAFVTERRLRKANDIHPAAPLPW